MPPHSDPVLDRVSGVDESGAICVPSIPYLIYSRLRREIAKGVYPPGRINIKHLAEHFGVSSMPVREALRRLESEGLVSFKAGRQVVINSLSLADIEEIFVIREALEELAMRLAVPKLTNDAAGLAGLDELLQEMARQRIDPAAWRHFNEEFHHTIYRATGMPRLELAIDSQWVLIAPYLPVYADAPEVFTTSQQQHRQMVDAIRAGDAEAAAAHLRDQLKMTLDRLRQSFIHAPDDS
jgi:DNA-binding GntR family transcriptional regulator